MIIIPSLMAFFSDKAPLFDSAPPTFHHSSLPPFKLMTALRYVWTFVVVLCLYGLASEHNAVLAQIGFVEAHNKLVGSPTVISAPILGASAIDIDQDGRVDLFRPMAHYMNQGTGGFVNIAQTTRVSSVPLFTHGGTWGDANADGLLDVLVMGRNGGAARLYLNDDGQKFSVHESFEASGLGGIWGDFDNDSYLDLIMVERGGVTLHRNLGNAQFVAQPIVAEGTLAPVSCGAAAADYDRDRDLDVFVFACDQGVPSGAEPPAMHNTLLRNNGDGTFEDVSLLAGTLEGTADDPRNQQPTGSVLWIDFDNDGWLDLWEINTGNTPSTSRLFRNKQDGTFSYQGPLTPPGEAPEAVVIGDFTNNGWMDMYMTVNRNASFFENRGNGAFHVTFFSPFGGQDYAGNTRALVTADLNNDGWLDLFSSAQDIDRLLYQAGGTNHWLRVHARSATGNRFGVGAEVELVVDGGMRMVRQIQAGSGGASQSHNLSAHFGLGTASRIDSLVVRWPSGVVDGIPGTSIAVDQDLTVVESQGLNAPPSVAVIQPGERALVPSDGSEVVFEWKRTDGETDEVTYELILDALTPGGIQPIGTFPSGTDTELRIPSHRLRQGFDHAWKLRMTDGFSVRQTPIQKFMYTTPRPSDLIVAPFIRRFQNASSYAGSIDAGDYDGDGDADLVISGRGAMGAQTTIYRLDEEITVQVFEHDLRENDVVIDITKVYTQQPGATLPGTTFGGAAWGDSDDDGDLDLFLHGFIASEQGPEPQARIYENVDGRFLEGVVLDGIVHGHAAWQDYDNDGRDDLLFMGATSPTPPYAPITRLYRNTETGFSEVSLDDVPGFFFSHIAWGDYDNDGDPDFAITGAIRQGLFRTYLYRNDGGGRFTQRDVGLANVMGGSVDWGDYDSDGDLDLLLTGSQLSASLLEGRTLIYRNDGNEQFVAQADEIPQGVYGNARWGDWDLDGDLDIVVTGTQHPLSEPQTQLFVNENGLYVLDRTLFGGRDNDLLFEDYNGDGDLDLIILGRDTNGDPAINFLINCQRADFFPPSLGDPETLCN